MNFRRIYLTGSIDADAYVKLSKKLLRVPRVGYQIDLVLSSEGGNTYDALAIYDLITDYRSNNMVINIYATGLVASAATLILAAGSTRYMQKNAWVMVHEDTNEIEKYQKVSDMERASAHARRLEDQWNELLAKHTKLTAKEWTELNKTDLYLTPDECLAYGLIDKII